MRRRTIHIVSLLLLLFAAGNTLHAQTDTTGTEKRLIDELTTRPEFKGDVNKYIVMHHKYPPVAQEANITGTVYVRFMVDEHGAVQEPFVARNTRRLGAGLEEEAIRLVKSMPAWQPGTYKGKPVRVIYTLPVVFKLE
ncbi:MAG: energy transducer TonB [Chitinophagaceae bacterium]|nr:energy transducer TonB [Chitinophagaceae bacterium]MCB9045269.1 energy transducer TonB [Chitinophagales bacterium]